MRLPTYTEHMLFQVLTNDALVSSDALDMNIDLNTVPLADDLDNRVYLNAVDTTASEEINVCLLYTSPSPRDLSTSRMPSSA